MEIIEPMDDDGFYKARHTKTKRSGLIPCNFIALHQKAPEPAKGKSSKDGKSGLKKIFSLK